MTSEEIKSIVESRSVPGEENSKLIETHISWVILTRSFAFKIKKPVSFSFLDFSSLEQRKFFCERELQLNSRLAKDVYLKVLPVKKQGNKITIGSRKGKIIDYAVQMKRLQRAHEMDRMLDVGKVSAPHVVAVAEILAPFHRHAEVLKQPFNVGKLKSLFNDISGVAEFIETKIKKGGHKIVQEAIRKSNAFLLLHRSAFQQRAKDGFIRDCHGDLHSGNIFLYKKPVIFDCLEFNDTFRQIDVLSELAFFCMDLEEYGRKDLSDTFLKHYNKLFPVIRNESDVVLFRYYKLYRANIRTKVNALKAMQVTNEQKLKKRTGLVASYLRLMERYLKEL
jgi:aminoglycoside phosphotransferase family enzyme